MSLHWYLLGSARSQCKEIKIVEVVLMTDGDYGRAIGTCHGRLIKPSDHGKEEEGKPGQLYQWWQARISAFTCTVP